MEAEQENTSPTRSDEEEANTTVHAFNASLIDVTVIEKDKAIEGQKNNSCEGSDSGVEVIENCTFQRTISTNSHECESITPAQSCDSSIISCCSNYEDAFNVLVRRNSTLLDDYKLRYVDGTSENGSESSSVASTKISKRSAILAAKKKVTMEKRVATNTPPTASRSRAKPPITPRPSALANRTKSSDRVDKPATPRTPKTITRTKPVPDQLNLKKEVFAKKTPTRTPSQTRSNISTPTDDGRWPSNFSKPAPTMTRSLRGILPLEIKPKDVKNTLEKYATLPRRRRERSVDAVVADVANEANNKLKSLSRESSISRVTSLKKKEMRSIPPKTPLIHGKLKTAVKTKIYHETACQTALDRQDIEKALAGINFNPANPQEVDKYEIEIQTDIPDVKFQQVEEQLALLKEKYDELKSDHAKKCAQLDETKTALTQERLEKDGLKHELKTNNERVIGMLQCYGLNELGDTEMLESRLQKVSHIIIKQEEEISKLNEYCRSLQCRLDTSMETTRSVTQQLHDQKDLQEFLQIEKHSLGEELKESEVELQQLRNLVLVKEQKLDDKQEECKHLVRANEQKRQENLGLQARFTALEAKCRELLVHQGSTVSGAAVALTSLNSRLESLVDQLTVSYNFTDEDLDDVIFHNEAYSNSSSSPDATPDKLRKLLPDKTPSPKRGSSFIAAVIGAIKNAANVSTFHREDSKDTVSDSENSMDILDSETEPCLMMEHVLEDVVVPDSHSVNMISSGHSMISSMRLSHTESLNSLSQAIRNRERCEAGDTTLTDISSPISLVDQVIDADNLLTRLLKIIRIIQTENEDYMNDLQDERDSYVEQVSTHRESNKIVVKQLKDWEHLGAKLKSEVKELLAQLSKKNGEIEEIKNELNAQRQEVEKLNQDVCDLSTALSKTEVEMKEKEEQAAAALRHWANGGDMPQGNLLSQLLLLQKEVPSLKESLANKEKLLSELQQEYKASGQVLTENLRDAINEAKKQYNAIDNALETLQSIQSVVQQCPALLQLQRNLEETSFQSASAMPLVVPPDFNANAAFIQSVSGLGAPINSSA